MIALYVLFCLANQSYRKFEELVEPSMKTLFGKESVPDSSTMWRAWRRIPPAVLHQLTQLSGKGGRDKVGALDPTHFQIKAFPQNSVNFLSFCRTIVVFPPEPVTFSTSMKLASARALILRWNDLYARNPPFSLYTS